MEKSTAKATFFSSPRSVGVLLRSVSVLEKTSVGSDRIGLDLNETERNTGYGTIGPGRDRVVYAEFARRHPTSDVVLQCKNKNCFNMCARNGF